MSKLYKILEGLAQSVSSKDELREYLVSETEKWISNYKDQNPDYDPDNDKYPYFEDYGDSSDSDDDRHIWIEDILDAVYNSTKEEYGTGQNITRYHVLGIPEKNFKGYVNGSGLKKENVSITLTAKKKGNYQFSKWKSLIYDDEYTSSSLNITDDKPDILQAIFTLPA